MDMRTTKILSRGAKIPWWGKIAAKVILARLPLGHQFWKRLGLFQFGPMEQPAYAYGVFQDHFDRARLSIRNPGFVGLELGPGDSLLYAMVAYAFGASSYYLVDVGAFATQDLKPYRSMAQFLGKLDLPVPELESMSSLEAILAACRASYGTSGLDSLWTIPDSTVDFIWSHTVLQHIKRSEFPETMRQLRRVLRADGVCSHHVALYDMLGGGLHHLRFSERVWESRWMSQSGFYTNRLRFSEMLSLFKEAGFAVTVERVLQWDHLPIARSKLWSHFQRLPEDDLCISGFHAILRPI